MQTGGLGFLIATSTADLAMDQALAASVVTILIALTFYLSASLIERSILMFYNNLASVVKRSAMSPKHENEANYQSQDIWSRTTSINGYGVDELRSVLQKSIRRGWVEDAALAAYELFSSGPETEEILWRRLEIIATEDVGLGLVTAPAIIEALNQQRQRMPDRGDRWIYCAHAVRLLATAQKDNMSMDLPAGRVKL